MARDQTRGSLTSTHFAILNQIRTLEDQRELLLPVLEVGVIQQPLLNPSISASENPIYPKIVICLVIGLLAGVLMGICIVLGLQARKVMARISMEKL